MKSWYRPGSLLSAVDFLARHSGCTRIIQGGTDVMVGRSRWLDDDVHWLDLSGIAELRELYVGAEGGLIIGAGVPIARLRVDPNVVQYWPNLAGSASQTGAPAIQNRATLGGNICNASPAADNAPALLAYNAELEIIGPSGYRRLPYRDFHLSYRRTALEPNELLVRIVLPRMPADVCHYYRKVGTRAAQAIAKVGLSAVLHWNLEGAIDHAQFAFSSVAATPRLAVALGKTLCGKRLTQISLAQIQGLLEEDIAPVSDIRSSDSYRREIAGRLVWQALHTSIM
ncbi:xanthine dehydrogenase family protein subunit M (plasmid) [Acidithiobacillus caldus]|uniref:Molybdopterin dehydrogenase FAD-binding protein n=1 Tax=Acidithiobacillus caldus (strain SM-1) TaxID=990288 RepID=F9ZUK5_ACICS|nr:xanthine dehydrogenase family protein subunit M [Acidithiobacillus caldus]AEK59553.1 molybdopterin dehydrogenase FAD-binding protein [Acidithiobacillus caldus SM-1]AUW34122.1 xanthine dehydrogenase family protein subunit M [Acidithiobacillus caldus]